MTLLTLVLGFLLAPFDAPPAGPARTAAAAASARSAPTRPGISWAEADSLSRKLAAIEEHHNRKKGKLKPVPVSQGEVNSYLNLSYASELPKGVSDVEVRFQANDRIEAKGQVDLDQVRDKVAAPSGWNPLNLLGGKVPVEVSGRLVNKDGFGTIELQTAYVANIRVPVTVVEQMVSSSTRSEKRPDGFDINAPFRLPYSVNRVRVEPGKATLEF